MDRLITAIITLLFAYWEVVVAISLLINDAVSLVSSLLYNYTDKEVFSKVANITITVRENFS